MSKKKNKKTKGLNMLKEIDKNLDRTYDNLKEEIEAMQIKLAEADMKALKKIKKMEKKGKGDAKEYVKIKADARNEVISGMESSNFLDRVYKALNEIAPIITVIARLVASLILSILSLDIVKKNISEKTMKSIDTVYKKAMAIA